MEILEVIDIGEDAAGRGIVLQVINDTVHLIHRSLSLVELVLLAQLITVSLADGAVFTGPLVPDMAAQLIYPIGLLLPDPQQFVYSRLPVGTAQSHNGEFLCQIIAVHHAEGLDGVGRGTVLPSGTDIHAFVRKTFLQNFAACLLVKFVSSAHNWFLQNFIWVIISQSMPKKQPSSENTGALRAWKRRHPE